MPHIHTKPGQYDFTASAYIVRTDGPEPLILLHQHRVLKQWLQFGGHVELAEDPWQAVQHEVREESGYELSQLKLLQPNMKLPRSMDHKVRFHPLPANICSFRFGAIDHFHTDIGYVFVTTEPPAHQVAAGESHELRGFTRTEVASLPTNAIPVNVRDLALLILDDYLTSWSPADPASWS